MIKRLTPRERAIAGVCFFVIGVYIFLYQGVYQHLDQRTQHLKARIETKKKELMRNLKLMKSGEILAREYQGYVDDFGQGKPNEQMMSDVISEIEQVASELSLRISDLKPKRVQAEDFYNQFSVSLTIDSDLTSMLQFLYLLQSHPHRFAVDEFRLDKGARRNTAEIKSNLVLSKVFIPKE